MTREEAIIDLNALKFILDNDQYTDEIEEALDTAISALQQPEIVRCVSCTYWDWEKRGSFETRGFCRLLGEVERSWHDYCSYAERRTDEQNT